MVIQCFIMYSWFFMNIEANRMNKILDSLDLVAERMQQEQSDLKAVIKERMQIKVTDTEIKDSVDRLIYNHCLKKKELQELFGLSRVTFNTRIVEALKQEHQPAVATFPL